VGAGVGFKFVVVVAVFVAFPGDLAFFSNAEEKITHVGILINNSQIIHAYGTVHIDTIDHQGIINSHTGLRTHSLRLINRFLS
jgi:uncharacterized protein YfaT (DUF1175 family)